MRDLIWFVLILAFLKFKGAIILNVKSLLTHHYHWLKEAKCSKELFIFSPVAKDPHKMAAFLRPFLSSTNVKTQMMSILADLVPDVLWGIRCFSFSWVYFGYNLVEVYPMKNACNDFLLWPTFHLPGYNMDSCQATLTGSPPPMRATNCFAQEKLPRKTTTPKLAGSWILAENSVVPPQR